MIYKCYACFFIRNIGFHMIAHELGFPQYFYKISFGALYKLFCKNKVFRKTADNCLVKKILIINNGSTITLQLLTVRFVYSLPLCYQVGPFFGKFTEYI